MAALSSCFLELEPMATGNSPAAAAGAARPPTDTVADCVHKARQKQQQLLILEPELEEGCSSDDEERCTVSPGCSFESHGDVALAGSLLLLEDDVCSAPQLVHEEDGSGTSNWPKLPDGTAVAETFWDDFQARGMVYQYCQARGSRCQQ